MAPQLQKTEEKQTDDSFQNHATLASDNFKFEENQSMTSYEGFWVRKSRVRFLNGMYHKYHRKVAANKELASDDQKQAKLGSYMKKLLRNEHRLLKIELAKAKNKASRKKKFRNSIKNQDHVPKKSNHLDGIAISEVRDDAVQKSVSSDEISKVPKKKKPGKYLGINYTADPDIVNYEGFYIYATATRRLDKLKKKLRKKGMAAEEIRNELRKECRKEERLCKRGKKKKDLCN